MLNESVDVAAESEARRSMGLKFLAVICAVLVTGALLVGYAVMRKRHAQQTLAAATPVEPPDTSPKGPPRAQIIFDEPLLKGSERIIGGRVKNISGRSLEGLTVHLELRRRKDGELVESLVSVDPSPLEADQEGSYSVRLKAQDYGSVRLIGLSSEPNSTLLAYTSTQGKQRPPERIESKTIVMRPVPRRDEFLNSPDSPARVR
jgi:hypothetical protein